MRVSLVKQEVLDQINRQKAAHAVIGKALPHLGEKQDAQAFGVIFHLSGDWENRPQSHQEPTGKHDVPNNTPKIRHDQPPIGAADDSPVICGAHMITGSR